MVKMKDSGIEWIGEIPEDWKFSKLGRISEIITDGTHQTPNYIEEGYPFISIKDISSGRIDFSDVKYISKLQHQELYAHAPVKKGDILFTRIGTLGVFVEVDTDVIFDFFVSVGMIRLIPNLINQHYLIHYLNSPAVGNFIQSIKAGFGTAAPKYNLTDVKKTWVLIPPAETQKRIADFLDAKCDKIDSLKNDIQKQIETLEQYKKSVITEAVTKGINPNAKMKDSGIEWIGEIPESWEVKRIGQIYVERREKVSDRDFPPLSVTMKGIVPQLETAAKSDAHDDRKLVCKGDFAINSRSDRRGSCGISPCDGSISLINTVLTPLGEMNPVFYNWLFHTPIFADEFYKNGHGIVDDLWTTSWQEMKRIFIPLPGKEEQAQIADYLDKKCSSIDSIISSKIQQLEKLEEYKKSLIFEYVTGKKEVPEEI